MKKFTFKNVLDGFRSSVNTSNNQSTSSSSSGGGPDKSYPINEIVENLKPDYFNIAKTFCHGFPFQPTAIAFDPVLKLIAIGTQNGSLRILGRPGVDIHIESITPPAAILHLEFLVNEGKLVGGTSDDVLHVWNFRENQKPEIIHSLKFQRERVTCVRIPLQSKWMYVGTERGNIHVVNVDTFQLSGYIVNWNKAIELSRKTHPGCVIYLGDNPTDPSKLLIAYDSGQIVLWDLRLRQAEIRFQSNEPLRSIAWHSDGKSFISSHTDGSLLTWNTRVNKPISASFPHARGNKEGKIETFRSIQKVDWKSSRTGENFVIFSGGLSNGTSSSDSNFGNTPSLTVIHGKTTTVLEMEHTVLDFIVICESQWESEIQDPTGIIVLLQSDLVIIDLLTPGYPCYPNPYPMDIHESPVTTCVYIANCPGDLIPALYSVGSKVNKKAGGYSDREWPVNGGTWGTGSCSYAEVVVTGHADGSVKFWDASSTSLQVLYKLKTSKPFERQQSKKSDDSDPYAVQLIKVCPESRLLLVAGASSQALLFKFRRHETLAETSVIEIPIVSDLVEDEFGGFDYSMRVDRDKLEFFSPLRVRSGPIKKSPGYQIELVCLTPWVNGEPPGGICSLAMSSGNGLLGYGTETGVVIVDYIQQVCLLSTATPDLYGTADPYTRAPKSPSSLKKDDSPPDSQQSFDNCASTPSGDTEDFILQQNFQQLQLQQQQQQLLEQQQQQQLLQQQQDKSKQLAPPSNDEQTTSMAVKSPKTSWSNVKTILTKGFQKKNSSAGLSTESASSTGTGVPPTTSTFYVPDSNSQNPPPIKNPQKGFAKMMSGRKKSTPTSPTHKNSKSENLEDSKILKKTLSSTLTTPTDNEIKFLRVNELQDDIANANASSAIVNANSNMNVNSSNHSQEKESNTKEKEDAFVVVNPAHPEDETFVTEAELLGVVQNTNSNITAESQTDHSSLPMSNEPLESLTEIGGRSQSPPLVMESQQQQPVPQQKVDRPKDLPLTLSSAGPPIPPPRRPKQKKSKVIDLRCTNSNSLMTSVIKKIHKLDSTFSRSRSSSMSSLDNITSESIQCLTFVETFPRKHDSTTSVPTVWVGTSLGSILVLNIGFTGSDRQTDSLTVTPSGTIFRLKGSILEMCFMDANGTLISGTTESWKDEAARAKTPTKTSSRGSPTDPQAGNAPLHYAILVSEKQSRVVSLPSQTCLYKAQMVNSNNSAGELPASSSTSSSSASYFVIKAGLTTIKDSPCLVTYNSNGRLSVYGLPSLKILIDVEFVPLSDLSFLLNQSSSGVLGGSGSGGTRKSGLLVDPMLSIWGQQIIIGEDTNLIAKTFCFSEYGHGMYLSSPSEMQKFTISAEFSQVMDNMLGTLFTEAEFPERPKEGFFTGLFGGGVRNLDREELFGETAGKAPRSVAKLLPTSTGSPELEHLKMRSSTAASEVQRARMLLVERGEKLGQLEDKTAKMMNDAENFSSAAHQLMLKYKDKKWYQL